jgi:hypothetical protein
LNRRNSWHGGELSTPDRWVMSLIIRLHIPLPLHSFPQICRRPFRLSFASRLTGLILTCGLLFLLPWLPPHPLTIPSLTDVASHWPYGRSTIHLYAMQNKSK